MLALYQEIGGSSKLDEICGRLYVRVSGDPELIPFFEGIDMNLQKQKLRAFLSTVSGGPKERSSIELRAHYARAVESGLSHVHLDAFVGHFRNALVDCNVRADLIEDLVDRVEQTRFDVLGM